MMLNQLQPASPADTPFYESSRTLHGVSVLASRVKLDSVSDASIPELSVTKRKRSVEQEHVLQHAGVVLTDTVSALPALPATATAVAICSDIQTPPQPTYQVSENRNYRLYVQKMEAKRVARICAGLGPCLPAFTTKNDTITTYNAAVSIFQSLKGLNGADFESTLLIPPVFDGIIGLQRQVTINSGLMDVYSNDGREDFVPYLIANGHFKGGDHVPVVISHKISLRERWKEDIGIAKYSRVFLITIGGLKSSDLTVSKLKKARDYNIQIVVPNLLEFQDNVFVTKKRPYCLTESQMWNQIHGCLVQQIISNTK
jgi:hypothetical protein